MKLFPTVFQQCLPASSAGKFALFRTVPEGGLYAAQIVDGNERTASLLWHSGNIYAPGETPSSHTFTRSSQECNDALEYAGLNAASNSNVSLIRRILKFTIAHVLR